MSFSYTHLDSAAQLPYVAACYASDCLTEAKARSDEKLRHELFLEGWVVGPNPWDPTYQLDNSGTDTLSAAKARIAAKKVRFTVLEDDANDDSNIAPKTLVRHKLSAKRQTKKVRFAFDDALEAVQKVDASDSKALSKTTDTLMQMRIGDHITNTQYADLLELLCVRIRALKSKN
jgi:hypothetical protein